MNTSAHQGSSGQHQIRGYLIGLFLLFLAYSAFFVYRTSFLVEGNRFFSLFDDMMISMRYARNLADGFGLRWNPKGDAVEGFTNLLWTLYMAAFHFLPVPDRWVSLFIQVSGVIFLGISGLLACAITSRMKPTFAWIPVLSAGLTLFYLPLVNWSLQGTEVSLLSLILLLAVRRAFDVIDGEKGPGGVYWLLGLGTLVRMDMAVVYCAVLLFFWSCRRPERVRHLRTAIPILLVFLGGLTLFRYLYFHEWLSNTYFLKMTGYPFHLRVARGLYVFVGFVVQSNLFLFLIPFGALFFRRSSRRLLLLFPFTLQCLYSIYVGGDAWEWWGNRYIAIVMPLLFVSLADTLDHLLRAISTARAGSLRRWNPSSFLHVPVLLVFLLFNFNAFNHPFRGLAKVLTITPPLHSDLNKTHAELSLFIERITTPRAKIAVVLAGTLPYFTDRHAIDLLGINDRVIARQPAHILGEGLETCISFYPGHQKWDARYSVLELRPDVVVPLPPDYNELEMILQERYEERVIRGQRILLLKGSPDILWSELDGPLSTGSR